MKHVVLSFLFVIGLFIYPADNVSFKLWNNTPKAIPLYIPDTMNPNLSPFSSSGVDLDIGQKIFFINRGETYLLLEVDSSLEGQKVNVAKLIRKRKKELNL